MAETKKRLHVCIGFYLNDDFKINHVRDEDLASNVEYNERFRPGRFYFVDGKYACGGLLAPKAKAAFIAKCEAKIKEMNLPEPTHDSRPYQ